jgi:polyvinyl alcohol dehydrogenase (cytochrome)
VNLGASDWPKYCGNLQMTGVASSAGSLSPATARFLAPAWSARVGPVASQPTVAGDTLYIGDWDGDEWAFDAVTGVPLAFTNLGITTMPQCVPPTIGITSTAAISNGVLYLAGGDDGFYALDSQTLETKWRVSLGDNSATGGYYGWCSPAVARDVVLQGTSSNCDDPFIPGRLLMIDTLGGDVMNDGYMVVPEWPHNFSGAGIWTSPAVDLENDAIFVTTGSAKDVEDGHSYSIVRLSLDTLNVESSWKLDRFDVEDADWGTSPTLFNDATGRQLVGAGEKNGEYFAFLRDAIDAGPIWRTPLAYGGACPLCADGILSTAAFDGERLYVGTGRPLDGQNALGSVTALDPATGDIVWQRALSDPVIAPITYANGVLLTTSGAHVIAIDAKSGELLWSYATNGTCVGGVAVTDRGIFAGDLAGTLYAFHVVPPPPRTRAVRH